VKHLDIIEDLFNEDQMIETMRKGWKFDSIFGVGWSDQDVYINY
jgi:hypothetical protein